MIIVGDLHIRDHANAYGTPFNTMEESHRAIELAFELAASDTNAIVQVGDLFDRHHPTWIAMDATLRLFARMFSEHPSCYWYQLTGNHEVPAFGGPTMDSPISVLSDRFPRFIHANGVHSIDSTLCLFAPFFRHEAHFLDYLSEAGLASVLFMHQDLHNVIKSSVLSADHPAFERFKRIFNGHIHNPGKDGKITTTGASAVVKATDRDLQCPFLYKYSPVADHALPIPTGGRIFKEVAEGEEWSGWRIPPRPAPKHLSFPTQADDTGNPGRLSLAAESIKDNELLGHLEAFIKKLDTASKPKTSINIHSIHIEGFRSHLDTTYRFANDQPTIIRGPVGSGKSCIFKALRWALYGKPLEGQVAEVVTEPHLRDNWKGTRVIVRVSVEGRDWEVARHIDYSGQTRGLAGKSEFMVYDPHDPNLELWRTDLSNSDRTTAWAEFMGMSLRDFDNMVLFSPQRSKIISASHAERRELLELSLDVRWVDDLAETVAEAADTAEAEARGIRERLEHANQTLEAALWGVDSQRTMHDARRRDIEDRIQTQNAEREKKMQELGELVQQRDKCSLELEILQKESEAWTSAKEAERTAKARLDAASDTLNSLDAPEPPTWSEHLDGLALVRKELSDLERALDAQESTLSSLFDQKASIKPKGNVCAVCGSSIEDMREVEKAIVDLDQRITDTQEIIQLGKEARSKCFKSLETKERAHLEAVRQQQEVMNSEFNNRLSAARREYNEAERLWKDCLIDEATLTLSRSAADKLNALSDKLAHLQTEIQRLEWFIPNSRETLEVEKKSLHAEISRFKAWSDDMDQKIAEMRKASGQLEMQLQEKEKSAGQLIALLKHLRSSGGLKSHVVGKKLSALNRKLFELSSTLDIGLEITASKGKYNAEITIGGQTRPHTSASEGQRGMANLLLALSLAEVAKGGANVNTLLLDEPFSNMDSDTARRVAELLQGRSDLHIITHTSNLDESGMRIVTVAGGVHEPSRL